MDSYVNAKGHNEVIDKAVNATCTETGLTEGKHCSICGLVLVKQETVPAKGHAWDGGVVKTPATEDSAGLMLYTCQTCGETREEVIPELDHVHSYTSEVTPPTCTEGGYTTYICACGETYAADHMDALGHDYQDGICIRCGDVLPVAGTVVRISGKDRCATARKVADAMKDKLGIRQFETILYTSGDNFADALAGSYLSAVKTAPVLLYRASGAAENLAYIEANLSENGTVYILGGSAAVPEDVAVQLESTGIHVQRLSGKTRFLTNLEILKESGFTGGKVLVCTGYNFADSLSASATGLPILLVHNEWTELSADYRAFLEAYQGQCEFIIIGGSAAVKTELESDLAKYGSVTRLSGKTRYETSVLVAQTFFEGPTSAVLAYAKNFPDGLCGGALAHAMGAPLILTNTGSTGAAAGYISGEGITSGAVLGGTILIDDASVAEIFQIDPAEIVQ